MESFLKCASLIVALYLPAVIFCLPLNENQQHLRIIPSNEEINYVEKYGHLRVDPKLRMNGLYNEDNIIETTKNAQKFGGIELTDKTKEIIRKPICGSKVVTRGNRPKRYTVVEGWKKRELTYYVANWNQNLGEYVVRENIKKALNMWAKHGRLTFTPSNDPSADLKFSFVVGDHGDLYPFDGQGSVLGHAFFPNSPKGGSVHFDNAELWTVNATNPNAEEYNFFSVALHLIGHALGLGHSSVEGSIMHPFYLNNVTQLHDDDVQAISELYIKRFDEKDTNSIDNTGASNRKKHRRT